MAMPPKREAGAALTTGASSGIGEEFARRLAALGYNLVLVARREDRLRALAQECSKQGVRAEVMVADLSDPQAVAGIPERVETLGLEVDLLVNNAGFGYLGSFVESPLGSQVGQIRVNCEAPVALTHFFLPGMIERGAGAVINVASSAGYQPLPYEAVYAASKAFALNFSDAVHAETRGTGVAVVAVNPGPVSTEWQRVAGRDKIEKLPPPTSAKQVVEESLDAVEHDKRSIIPGLLVRLGMIATMPLPRSIKLRVMERAYRP